MDLTAPRPSARRTPHVRAAQANAPARRDRRPERTSSAPDSNIEPARTGGMGDGRDGAFGEPGRNRPPRTGKGTGISYRRRSLGRPPSERLGEAGPAVSGAIPQVPSTRARPRLQVPARERGSRRPRPVQVSATPGANRPRGAAPVVAGGVQPRLADTSAIAPKWSESARPSTALLMTATDSATRSPLRATWSMQLRP